MNLPALPAFDDNCIWMLQDERRALVGDPVEPSVAARPVDARGFDLAGILVIPSSAASRRTAPVACVDGAAAVLAAPGPWKTPFR